MILSHPAVRWLFLFFCLVCACLIGVACTLTWAGYNCEPMGDLAGHRWIECNTN